MHGIRFAFAAALAVGALVAGGCGGDEEGTGDAGTTDTTATETTTPEPSSDGAVLKGSVGPGFVISLTTADGQPAAEIPAGRYQLEVEDLSPIHNFHLTGPGGVDVSTSVAGEGTESFEIELVPGTYAFVCDPHATQMNGELDVT